MSDDSFRHGAGDPDLAAAARRDRAERRAEASDYERLGAQHLLRERRLGDVAVELLHRGDVVVVDVAGRRLTGTVAHAAADLVCLQTASGEVDVHLAVPLVLRVVDRVAAGGRGRSNAGDSFKARLFAHEATGAAVEVGTIVGDDALHGVLVAVARDHVVVRARDGVTSYVALTAVGYVRADPDRSLR